MKPRDKETGKPAITAADFRKMIVGASYFFDREKEAINALNVFPVPDGDTGSNMSMTLSAAAEAALAYRGETIGEIAVKTASSALMGARGNSGVILSQLLRGIARGLQGKREAYPDDLSKAFQYGVVYAYKAVSKPVEGTILTVARSTARSARIAARSGAGLCGIIERAIAGGREALEKTTEMLPALKEAGVVDAGGAGLIVFLEGCLFSVQHALGELLARKKNATARTAGIDAAGSGAFSPAETPDLAHPYCTELIIRGAVVPGELKERLEPLGDSLVVVEQGDMSKVHLHTADPGAALSICREYGTLHKIKIDNMADQHQHLLNLPTPVETVVTLVDSKKAKGEEEIGIITVSFGEGIGELFLSLGADEIVYGGQTMNPRVEDLFDAVQRIPTERVIIMPNNKNIQMVAQQVQKLSEKEVAVIGTATIAQGLAALIAFNPAEELDSNISAMERALKQVKSGEVTYAIRDTVIKGKEVAEGSFLGLYDGEICCTSGELAAAALELTAQMLDEDDELITILYGKEIARAEAAALAELVEEAHPSVEVELKYGGQPIYYYIFAVE
ncbi:MAG TPA: DAK2 domain-containing protein [Firmicutes bacterium]|nr:DAK2 domain-containing protein [Bacillota bacterium]